MDNSFDFIAMATGLVAIWYTIHESRRNNSVLLRIVECQTSGRQAISENNSQIFNEFRLIVRNCGIPLHRIGASLSFNEPNEGYGRFNVPLRRRERRGDRDEFARGMIVEFGFKSYEMSKFDVAALKLLVDARKQDAFLVVGSQDYIATRFRIGGMSDRLNSIRNRIAFRYNQILDRYLDVDETSHRTIRRCLTATMRPVLSRQIDDFRRWTIDELERKEPAA